MLTDLQRRIALAVSQVVQGEGFALAGGAALIFQGVVDRRTRDLDFFAVDATAVNRVGPEVETALRSKGMTVITRVDAPGFMRLEVSEGDETCEVDFGSDARLRPVIETELGPMIASEELAADKTLALFGRAAARDFVDVFALSETFGQDRLLELAAEKTADLISNTSLRRWPLSVVWIETSSTWPMRRTSLFGTGRLRGATGFSIALLVNRRKIAATTQGSACSGAGWLAQ